MEKERERERESVCVLLELIFFILLKCANFTVPILSIREVSTSFY